MYKTSMFLLAAITALATSSAFNLDEFTINSRVVQGQNATRGQFPYYVFLKIQFPQGVGACGGSLIGDEWVVTAAHCVHKASGAEVHLGSLRAKDLEEKGRLILKVAKEDLHVHPKYFPAIVLNDIALIKLPQKVESTKTIKPVKLTCEPPKNLAVTVVGNGLLNSTDKEIAPILQYTDLKTVPLLRCLPTFPFLIYRKSVLCVIGAQQKSACRGDSGGPLISNTNGTLVGLTSFGSAEGCHLGYPQGYTSIASYLDWIKEVTAISECE